MTIGPPLAVDAQGNALLRLIRCTEEHLKEAARHTPCPLSLVIVIDETTNDVLFGLNHWHQSYELPGGMLEAGESFRAAAIRELEEETGIEARSLEFLGYAFFALMSPTRSELGAIYRSRRDGQRAHASDELTEFVWRRPLEPSDLEISVLDNEIASWAMSSGLE